MADGKKKRRKKRNYTGAFREDNDEYLGREKIDAHPGEIPSCKQYYSSSHCN